MSSGKVTLAQFDTPADFKSLQRLALALQLKDRELYDGRPGQAFHIPEMLRKVYESPSKRAGATSTQEDEMVQSDKEDSEDSRSPTPNPDDEDSDSTHGSDSSSSDDEGNATEAITSAEAVFGVYNVIVALDYGPHSFYLDSNGEPYADRFRLVLLHVFHSLRQLVDQLNQKRDQTIRYFQKEANKRRARFKGKKKKFAELEREKKRDEENFIQSMWCPEISISIVAVNGLYNPGVLDGDFTRVASDSLANIFPIITNMPLLSIGDEAVQRIFDQLGVFEENCHSMVEDNEAFSKWEGSNLANTIETLARMVPNTTTTFHSIFLASNYSIAGADESIFLLQHLLLTKDLLLTLLSLTNDLNWEWPHMQSLSFFLKCCGGAILDFERFLQVSRHVSIDAHESQDTFHSLPSFLLRRRYTYFPEIDTPVEIPATTVRATSRLEARQSPLRDYSLFLMYRFLRRVVERVYSPPFSQIVCCGNVSQPILSLAQARMQEGWAVVLKSDSSKVITSCIGKLSTFLHKGSLSLYFRAESTKASGGMLSVEREFFVRGTPNLVKQFRAAGLYTPHLALGHPLPPEARSVESLLSECDFNVLVLRMCLDVWSAADDDVLRLLDAPHLVTLDSHHGHSSQQEHRVAAALAKHSTIEGLSPELKARSHCESFCLLVRSKQANFVKPTDDFEEIQNSAAPIDVTEIAYAIMRHSGRWRMVPTRSGETSDAQSSSVFFVYTDKRFMDLESRFVRGNIEASIFLQFLAHIPARQKSTFCATVIEVRLIMLQMRPILRESLKSDLLRHINAYIHRSEDKEPDSCLSTFAFALEEDTLVLNVLHRAILTSPKYSLASCNQTSTTSPLVAVAGSGMALKPLRRVANWIARKDYPAGNEFDLLANAHRWQWKWNVGTDCQWAIIVSQMIGWRVKNNFFIVHLNVSPSMFLYTIVLRRIVVLEPSSRGNSPVHATKRKNPTASSIRVFDVIHVSDPSIIIERVCYVTPTEDETQLHEWAQYAADIATTGAHSDFETIQCLFSYNSILRDYVSRPRRQGRWHSNSSSEPETPAQVAAEAGTEIEKARTMLFNGGRWSFSYDVVPLLSLGALCDQFIESEVGISVLDFHPVAHVFHSFDTVSAEDEASKQNAILQFRLAHFVRHVSASFASTSLGKLPLPWSSMLRAQFANDSCGADSDVVIGVTPEGTLQDGTAVLLVALSPCPHTEAPNASVKFIQFPANGLGDSDDLYPVKKVQVISMALSLPSLSLALLQEKISTPSPAGRTLLSIVSCLRKLYQATFTLVVQRGLVEGESFAAPPDQICKAFGGDMLEYVGTRECTYCLRHYDFLPDSECEDWFSSFATTVMSSRGLRLLPGSDCCFFQLNVKKSVDSGNDLASHREDELDEALSDHVSEPEDEAPGVQLATEDIPSLYRMELCLEAFMFVDSERIVKDRIKMTLSYVGSNIHSRATEFLAAAKGKGLEVSMDLRIVVRTFSQAYFDLCRGSILPPPAMIRRFRTTVENSGQFHSAFPFFLSQHQYDEHYASASNEDHRGIIWNSLPEGLRESASRLSTEIGETIGEWILHASFTTPPFRAMKASVQETRQRDPSNESFDDTVTPISHVVPASVAENKPLRRYVGEVVRCLQHDLRRRCLISRFPLEFSSGAKGVFRYGAFFAVCLEEDHLPILQSPYEDTFFFVPPCHIFNNQWFTLHVQQVEQKFFVEVFCMQTPDAAKANAFPVETVLSSLRTAMEQLVIEVSQYYMLRSMKSTQEPHEDLVPLYWGDQRVPSDALDRRRKSRYSCAGTTVLERGIYFKVSGRAVISRLRMLLNGFQIIERDSCYVIMDETRDDLFHFFRLVYVPKSFEGTPDPNDFPPQLSEEDLKGKGGRIFVQLYTPAKDYNISTVLSSIEHRCYSLAITELVQHVLSKPRGEANMTDDDLTVLHHTEICSGTMKMSGKRIFRTCFLANLERDDFVAVCLESLTMESQDSPQQQGIPSSASTELVRSPVAQTDGEKTIESRRSPTETTLSTNTYHFIYRPSGSTSKGVQVPLFSVSLKFPSSENDQEDIEVSFSIFRSFALPSESIATAARQLEELLFLCVKQTSAELLFADEVPSAPVPLATVQSLFEQLHTISSQGKRLVDDAKCVLGYEKFFPSLLSSALPSLLERLASLLAPFDPCIVETTSGVVSVLENFCWANCERIQRIPACTDPSFCLLAGIQLQRSQSPKHSSHGEIFTTRVYVPSDVVRISTAMTVSEKELLGSRLPQCILVKVTLSSVSMISFNIKEQAQLAKHFREEIQETLNHQKVLEHVLLQQLGLHTPKTSTEVELGQMCCGDVKAVVPVPFDIRGLEFRRLIGKQRFPPTHNDEFSSLVSSLANRGLIFNNEFKMGNAIRSLFNETRHPIPVCHSLLRRWVDEGRLQEESGYVKLVGTAFPHNALICDDFHRHLATAHILLETKNNSYNVAEAMTTVRRGWQQRHEDDNRLLLAGLVRLQSFSKLYYCSRVPDFTLRQETVTQAQRFSTRSRVAVTPATQGFAALVDSVLDSYLAYLKCRMSDLHFIVADPASFPEGFDPKLDERLSCRFGQVNVGNEELRFPVKLVMALKPIRRNEHTRRLSPTKKVEEADQFGGFLLVEVGFQLVHYALDFYVINQGIAPGDMTQLASALKQQLLFSSVLYDLAVRKVLDTILEHAAVLPGQQNLSNMLQGMTFYYPAPPNYAVNLIAAYNIPHDVPGLAKSLENGSFSTIFTRDKYMRSSTETYQYCGVIIKEQNVMRLYVIMCLMHPVHDCRRTSNNKDLLRAAAELFHVLLKIHTGSRMEADAKEAWSLLASGTIAVQHVRDLMHSTVKIILPELGELRSLPIPWNAALATAESKGLLSLPSNERFSYRLVSNDENSESYLVIYSMQLEMTDRTRGRTSAPQRIDNSYFAFAHVRNDLLEEIALCRHCYGPQGRIAPFSVEEKQCAETIVLCISRIVWSTTF